ncbi:hypothetical protein M2419_001311 [Sphingobacterium sp. BIGb0116]|nr:hypothetical protein [Sphingobacterium sp. BIGb0116]
MFDRRNSTAQLDPKDESGYLEPAFPSVPFAEL